MEQRKKPLLFPLILLVVAAGVFLAVYLLSAQAPEAGAKALTIRIVHGDGVQRSASLTTSAEYLREALEEQSLITGEEGPFGLFIHTVDGETADEAQQQWWCVTKSGQQLMTGVDSTPIQDGEHYELTLMTGY